MKTKITAGFLLLLTFSLSFAQQKAIGEAPLDIENFSFKTDISSLLPEKYKSKDYANTYEINIEGDRERSVMLTKKETFLNNYSPEKKKIGFEYSQVNWSNIDKMAVFKNTYFQKISIATTNDGKIKAIAVVADELTKSDSQNILKLLTAKFGTSQKKKSSWNQKLTIYEWAKPDRIIRFVTAYNDESTTLKIVVDKDKNTIENGAKEPHFVSYLFLIDPASKAEVFGKLNSGDFVYLNEEGK